MGICTPVWLKKYRIKVASVPPSQISVTYICSLLLISTGLSASLELCLLLGVESLHAGLEGTAWIRCSPWKPQAPLYEKLSRRIPQDLHVVFNFLKATKTLHSLKTTYDRFYKITKACSVCQEGHCHVSASLREVGMCLWCNTPWIFSLKKHTVYSIISSPTKNVKQV